MAAYYVLLVVVVKPFPRGESRCPKGS